MIAGLTFSHAGSVVTSAVDGTQQPPATADIPKADGPALAYIQSLGEHQYKYLQSCLLSPDLNAIS